MMMIMRSKPVLHETRNREYQKYRYAHQHPRSSSRLRCTAILTAPISSTRRS
ncbi:hypothetical protein AXF42_Ash004908 [Apostasia shenzhenica]|uniref:Uncharacterized protein n=1 Tax=Apostasia shenzhenica TaxID=1088818 RepID=A0A2I0B7X0_9ASPA|nr:hypothetical protein AXF42_Ash004908 [Apostasia shenzhenica]